MRKKCIENGKIAMLPEIPSVLVFYNDYVGVYADDGKVIELTSKSENGQAGINTRGLHILRQRLFTSRSMTAHIHQLLTA